MSKNTLKIIGIKSPVPIAWVKRPTNKIGKLGAKAQIVVPIVNIIIVPKNNFLVVNHCNNIADIGITTAMTNMKPVAIHCTVGKVILNSFINVVSAIFNNVSFNTAKKVPIIKESMIGMTFTLGSSAKNSYFFGSFSSFIYLHSCLLN